jgi:hypothetical protein
MFLNEKHSFIPIWKWGMSNIAMQIELNLIWIHIELNWIHFVK